MKILILQNSLHPKFAYFQLLRTFIIINNTKKKKALSHLHNRQCALIWRNESICVLKVQ